MKFKSCLLFMNLIIVISVKTAEKAQDFKVESIYRNNNEILKDIDLMYHLLSLINLAPGNIKNIKIYNEIKIDIKRLKKAIKKDNVE